MFYSKVSNYKPMRLTETMKITIEDYLCPIHDIHPVVEISAGEFQVICCCTAFHEECRKEVESVLAKMDITLNWNIV